MLSDDDDTYHSAIDSASSSNDASFSSFTDTLGDSLRNNFNNLSSSLFNVCHINAQSIPSHYSDLAEAFTDTNVHAILVSETWLKPHLPSTSYPLPGFVLIRNDRTDKRGGGVAVYIRSNFSFKILASSPPAYTANAEYLFLEVCVKGAKAIVGVVYCPPAVDYFSSLETVLESLGSEYSHHVIMGDFNTDLLAPQSLRTSKFLNIVKSASLHLAPLQATHHNIDGDDTWLDLILTSDPSRISFHGQHPAPGFSRHDLIFLSYILKPLKSPPKVLRMRCFGRMNIEKLHKDASQLNWDNTIDATTVDEKVGVFTDHVIGLFDIHAPVRNVKIRRPPAPWITPGVKMAMKRRDRAFRNYRRDRTDEGWNIFKVARNRCNQMVRNAKRRYIHDNITSCSPAGIWKFLGTLGIGKQRRIELQASIGLDDINRHFSSSIQMDHQTKCRTVDYLAGLPCPDIPYFEFSPVVPAEVKKVILSIKSNAVGCDNISRRMITSILDYVLPTITHIINFSLHSGTFPSLWRKAYIIPLPKISNPTVPSHFRPISILPFLSKVLEACVHKQLSRFVYQHNLLSPLQSGFRPGHSTVSALLKVTGDVRAGMEDSKVTVLALVDFSNAFNTVSHDILLSILSYLMISPEALEWFSTYLQERQQSVRINESSSNWCELDSGVPQGGILSPLLFSLFINLITQNLQCSYHLYADDLQLYSQASVDNLSIAIGSINQDLEEIKGWACRFGLAVNPTKCQAIVVGSPRMMSRVDLSTIPQIIFNGNIIKWSASVKNLGLHIDSKLDWQTHITKVGQKVTGILRAVYRLKNFLPCSTKTMLVQTLVLPIIDYGDVCCFDLNADLLNKLDRLLNNCIRFIFNLRKYDHVSSYRQELKWLPIRQRRNSRALTTVYSILNSPSPPSYLTPYFQFLCSNHDRNLRSSNNLLLLCPSHTSGFVNSSFIVQSVHLWNSLPLEIRMSTNRYVFKTRVRDHLFNELAKLTLS